MTEKNLFPKTFYGDGFCMVKTTKTVLVGFYEKNTPLKKWQINSLKMDVKYLFFRFFYWSNEVAVGCYLRDYFGVKRKLY
jgi:hypothetical protein